MRVIDIVDALPKHPSKRYVSRPIASIRKIVIHHSATPPNATPASFARYHIESRGWPGIGYHFVIDRAGQVFKTNHADTVTYHASGANAVSLGVCLIGNFDVEKPGGAQLNALVELVKDLMRAYGIRPQAVIGHREVPAHKSCPGRNFDMDAFRKMIGG